MYYPHLTLIHCLHLTLIHCPHLTLIHCPHLILIPLVLQLAQMVIHFQYSQ
jgi:hypothetical protein